MKMLCHLFIAPIILYLGFVSLTLQAQDVSKNDSSQDSTTTLESAVSHGDKAQVVQILSQCTQEFVNQQNQLGWTALHYSVARGDADITKQLIDHDAKVNLKSLKGATPLHEAAYKGNLE